MQKVGKPVVALFLGNKPEQRREGNVWLANSLSDAAQLGVLLMRVAQQRLIQPEVAGKGIYGLYAGGTLAAEAAMLLSAGLGVPVSEATLLASCSTRRAIALSIWEMTATRWADHTR